MFVLGAALGVIGVVVSWPVVRDRTHRKRILALYGLVIAGAIAVVVGQKLLDDLVCHARIHDVQR